MAELSDNLLLALLAVLPVVMLVSLLAARLVRERRTSLRLRGLVSDGDALRDLIDSAARCSTSDELQQAVEAFCARNLPALGARLLVGVLPAEGDKTVARHVALTDGGWMELRLAAADAALDERDRTLLATVFETAKLGMQKLHLEADRVRLARLSAIAQTTQMLAHDVRRPFTLMESILQLLEGARTDTDLRNVCTRYLPEVRRAKAAVNGMIEDVMEVGAPAAPTVEEIDLEDLLALSLREAFAARPALDAALTYDLRHGRRLRVDPVKVGRILASIVDNALQAVPTHGRLWVRSREIAEAGRPFAQVTIGNSGSEVAAEDLPRVFDAFFTKGKGRGTGLGLAVAQKLVHAHGGRIWCTSVPGVGVEFHFTLPLGTTVSGSLRALLASGQAFVTAGDRSGDGAPAQPARAGATSEAPGGNASELEATFLVSWASRSRPFRLLIVDDEAIYVEALKAEILGRPKVAGAAFVADASNGHEALREAAKGAFDLIIVDVDMGPGSPHGYDVVRALRAQGVRSKICVHSNRAGFEDHGRASRAGADAFLPKPMAPSHLLKLMISVAETPAAAAAAAADRALPELALVEDNEFIRYMWAQRLEGAAKLHVFENPTEFLACMEKDPSLYARLKCLILDYYFDDHEGFDGLELAGAVRDRVTAPILLSSDATVLAADLAGRIDLVIAKEPLSWDELASRLKSLT